MSKFSTFNYLINSYYAGKTELELFSFSEKDSDKNNLEFEPSVDSINAILSFASQYDVIRSAHTGLIELNMN